MIPDNLESLHAGEEDIRARSLKLISTIPDMAAHLAMVERCMDLIYALLPSKAVKDEDQLALGNLGVRLFNAIAAALKLMLSGYYQASGMHLRDVVETSFLLDYFSTDPALVARWRTAPERERKKEFKPVAIREALDARDGFTKKRRADTYNLLSNLAGHATPEGAAMLIPDRSKTLVHCGPFLEETALKAALSECVMHAITASQAFAKMMKNENLDQVEARISHLEVEADWFERFFGKITDRANIAELRAILAAAKAGPE